MKKKLIALMAILTIFIYVQPVVATTFSDLKTTHWAYNQIMQLVENGVINGYTDGTYKPEKAVTRGEFLKLIMVALYGGNDYFEINNFNIGHWAMPYAIEASRSGYLMNGTTVAGLDNPISRKEMVNILAKICLKNRIEKDELGTTIEFSDTSKLDENTNMYIDFVTENGLISGYPDGTFKPEKTMTRAEVATVMGRFLDLMY